MTKYTPEEIKNRLSNIGEAIGSIALEYIVELEKENEQLKQKLCKKEREFKYFSNSFKLKIQKLKDEIEIMKGERE